MNLEHESDDDDFEATYESNNKYELQLLELIDNARAQYCKLYPQRMPLMIAPQNEYEVRKCVCTSVRPSMLKNKALVTYEDTAKFVSDFIRFVKLSEFNKLPNEMASPTLVLKRQYGNCFEVSTVLVSLLIAQGYDAYVVSGYASREICNQDLSHIHFFHTQTIDAGLQMIDNIRKEFNFDSDAWIKTTNNGILLKTKTLQSKYDLTMKSRSDEELERKRAEILSKESTPRLVNEVSDVLAGMRIHSWILVLPGKRGVREAFFIEPSTGQTKIPNGQEYNGIESVWNNHNYWINLQDCSYGLEHIEFNLRDLSKWEALFQLPFDEQALLLKSWVNAFHISNTDAHKLYPGSQKVLVYKQTLVKHYAPKAHKNSCTLKIFEFKDDQMSNLARSTFEYHARANNLYRKVYEYDKDLITEFYTPGCQSGLLINQCDFNSNNRILVFDPYLRKDCLSLYEEHESCIEQYFVNRDNYLFYKKIFYTSSTTALDTSRRHSFFSLKNLKSKKDRRQTVRIIERYRQVVGTKNFYEIDFNLKSKKIKITYHKSSFSIARSTKTFAKPEASDSDFSNISEKYLLKSFDANNEPKLDNDELLVLLKGLIKREMATLDEVKQAEENIRALIKQLGNDEIINESKEHPMEIDAHRIQNYLSEKETQQENEHFHSDENLSNIKYNMLQTYLANDCSSNNIQEIKQKCLTDYQHSILRKINELQKRHDQAKTELLRQKSLLRQNLIDQENSAQSSNNVKHSLDEPKLLKTIEKLKFNVDVLTQRIKNLKLKAHDEFIKLKIELDRDAEIAENS